MSEPIGPGDWVEALVEGYATGHSFRPNVLYVVSDVGVLDWTAWINCVGQRTPFDCGIHSPGWDARSFRPIYRPKADLIEGLLSEPARDYEREVADAVRENGRLITELMPLIYNP